MASIVPLICQIFPLFLLTEWAHPVVSIGNMQLLMGISILACCPDHHSVHSMAVALASTKPIFSRNPILNIQAHPASSASVPLLKPLPINPGYQSAHQFYNEMREMFATRAYASSANLELVVVKVSLATLVSNKKSPVCISVSIASYYDFSGSHSSLMCRISLRHWITFQCMLELWISNSFFIMPCFINPSSARRTSH